MAIDPNIYAQFIQSRERPRLATVGEIEEQKALREDRAMQRKLQLDALRLRQQDAEAKAANDAAIAEAFRQGTGPDGVPRRTAVLGRLYQTSPTAAQSVEAWFTEQAQKQAALDKAEREGETDFLRKLAAANSPGALAMLRSQAHGKYQDYVNWYGPTPDATKQEYLRRAIGEADAYNKDVDAIRSRETQDAASVLELLAIARDQAHVDRAKERAALLGVDDEIEGMGLGWQFSPELSARAADLVRGVKGRDALAVEAVSPQNAGSDYRQFLERYAVSIGKTLPTMTAAEELDARRKYGQADNAAVRPLAPVVIQTGAGPQILDRSTGQVRTITDASGQTVGPAPTSDMRNRAAGRQSAEVVLNSISELSEKINTGRGAVAKVSGMVERAKAQANLNDDLSEYQAVVSGFTPLLARALGHTGVLTEQDVQSVRSMLPQPGDSKAVRDRKIARIHTIMAAMPQAQSGMTSTGGGSDEKAVTVADLQAIAKRRGTTVEQERERATAAGYVVR